MENSKPVTQEEREKALQFLRSIGMKNRRVLEGTERDHMITLLALVEPTETSNNQRTFTETYHHAGKEYELTWGFGVEGEPEPYVEEVQELRLKNDIQQN